MRPLTIALCIVLALSLSMAFVGVAMWLGRYIYTDIYIGALWSFILLSILFLSTISSRIERALRRRSVRRVVFQKGRTT